MPLFLGSWTQDGGEMRAPLWPPRRLTCPGPGVPTEVEVALAQWGGSSRSPASCLLRPLPSPALEPGPAHPPGTGQSRPCQARFPSSRDTPALPVEGSRVREPSQHRPPRKPPHPSLPWCAGHREPHLEVVQELCCDRVRCPNHYFRHVLWGQGAQLVSRDPAGLVGGGRWPKRPAKATSAEEETPGGSVVGVPLRPLSRPARCSPGRPARSASARAGS